VAEHKTSTLDLTEGNIVKMLLRFAVPIFAGQFLQNLYNSVDSIVVGRYVGTAALAAVSTCIDVSFLLIGFFMGMATGAGVLFSRYFGAKDYQRLHDSIHTAVAFSLILGAFMAVFGIVASPLLLHLMDCPADAYDGALVYLRIYLVGVLFTSIYNIGAGILRAVGDSRHPFYYLIVSCVINVVLDLLLTGVLGLEEAGVAMATVAAQGVSSFLVFRRLMVTDDVYRFRPHDLMLDKAILKDVVALGLPAAIQNSLTSFSNFFVQRYINSFHSSAVTAGIGAAKKVDRFANMTTASMGMAVTTFVSQNLGAGKPRRAFQGILACVLTDFTCISMLGIPIYLRAEALIGLFDSNPETIYYGVLMVHTIIPLFCLQSFNQIFASATRGFGHSRSVMVLALSGMIVVRQIFLAVSMAHSHDVMNVIVGFPVGWGSAAAFCMIYFAAVIAIPYLRGKPIEEICGWRSAKAAEDAPAEHQGA